MDKLREALEKLTKWRSVFAAWQLGTRSIDDPECKAVKDHRELTILLRAELNAVSTLLIEKGIVTSEEFQQQLEKEAKLLDRAYEQKFLGISTSSVGVIFDTETIIKNGTMKGWKP